jgi:ketosteroid isomerase-like protein
MNADLQVASGRRNQVTKTTPNRIVVARGGEMAHEYSTFHLSFDDEKGHTELDGAMLRVWQLQGNRWVIASEFRRPYGRVVAPTQPAK